MTLEGVSTSSFGTGMVTTVQRIWCRTVGTVGIALPYRGIILLVLLFPDAEWYEELDQNIYHCIKRTALSAFEPNWTYFFHCMEKSKEG